MIEKKKKALVFWSSGKDACLALHRTSQNSSFEVVGLISTLNEKTNKIDFHNVSKRLIQAQASSLNLPIDIIPLPPSCPNKEYERRVKNNLKKHASEGVDHLIFGDLFLSDIRCYREHFLGPLGFQLHFPLWKENTRNLAKEFIILGYQAVVCGIHSAHLSDKMLGASFSEAFLNSLPSEVDPCGENGEFHTFVSDGPLFQYPISFEPEFTA